LALKQQSCSNTDQSGVARRLLITTATTSEKASQASNTSALSAMLTVRNHNDGYVCSAVVLLKMQDNLNSVFIKMTAQE